MRECCEAYQGMTPLVFEQLHVNQILLLICDKDRLKGLPKRVTLTPREALAQGFLKSLPEKSYVQQVREYIMKDRGKLAAEQKLANRRERRRQKRNELKQAVKAKG